MFRTKTIAAMASAFLCAGTAANAASNVTAQFDGIYAGTAQPTPAFGSGCEAFVIDNVKIVNGFLTSTGDAGHRAVRGFITEEGYVAAYMQDRDKRYAMDGRLVEGVIVAGFIVDTPPCAWVLRLIKQP